MSKEKNRHAGHKKRLRARFLANNDFSGYQDHEILELILNYAQVQRNTNDIAHDLMDKFGSLDAVFDADIEELTSIQGVGEATATLLIIQKHLFGVYQQRKYDIIKKSPEQYHFQTYVSSLFDGAKKELFYMLCIDKKGRITKTTLVGRGSGSSVLLDQREIIRTSINANAWGVIFAHNHITGIAVASNDDIKSTKLLKDSLETVGIKLIDHFIVTDDRCVSVMEDKRFKLIK